jgi:ATP-dependent Clp protease ATP-binding subunit ClpA
MASHKGPFLLFGSTGSGKTEVYLRAAQEVLRQVPTLTVRYFAKQVGPEHILLGLIAEDSSKAGFLGCGITVSRAPTASGPRLLFGARLSSPCALSAFYAA